MPDNPPVGFDLGSSFSAVANLDAAGGPCTIRNADGDLTTPASSSPISPEQSLVKKLLGDTNLDCSTLTRLLHVGGSTRMPAASEMIERETGLKADQSLLAKESVAHGAAIYADLLLKQAASRFSGLSITNVSSHDLGILGVARGTGRKKRSTMIPCNTELPIKVRKKSPTLRDNQKSVEIHVIEGGDSSGQDSIPIGRCLVTGLPTTCPQRLPCRFPSLTGLMAGCRCPNRCGTAKAIHRRLAIPGDETDREFC